MGQERTLQLPLDDSALSNRVFYMVVEVTGQKVTLERTEPAGLVRNVIQQIADGEQN